MKRLELFQTKFYDNLETSKRAIANWKKIRTLIVMLKLCGGNINRQDYLKASQKTDKDKKISFREYLARKTMSPTNKYKVTWDLGIGFVYLFCYVIDPFIIAFKYEPIAVSSEFNRF